MTLVAAFDQRPLTWSRLNTLDPVVPKSIPAPYAQIARECLRMNPEDRCTLSKLRDLVHQAPPLPNPPAPKATGAAASSSAALIAVLAVGAVIFAVRSKHSTPKSACGGSSCGAATGSAGSNNRTLIPLTRNRQRMRRRAILPPHLLSPMQVSRSRKVLPSRR